MKKLFSLVLVTLTLSACKVERETVITPQGMRAVCLGGVSYYLFSEASGYQGYGYMSVRFKPDSTVVTCEEDHK